MAANQDLDVILEKLMKKLDDVKALSERTYELKDNKSEHKCTHVGLMSKPTDAEVNWKESEKTKEIKTNLDLNAKSNNETTSSECEECENFNKDFDSFDSSESSDSFDSWESSDSFDSSKYSDSSDSSECCNSDFDKDKIEVTGGKTAKLTHKDSRDNNTPLENRQESTTRMEANQDLNAKSKKLTMKRKPDDLKASNASCESTYALNYKFQHKCMYDVIRKAIDAVDGEKCISSKTKETETNLDLNAKAKEVMKSSISEKESENANKDSDSFNSCKDCDYYKIVVAKGQTAKSTHQHNPDTNTPLENRQESTTRMEANQDLNAKSKKLAMKGKLDDLKASNATSKSIYTYNHYQFEHRCTYDLITQETQLHLL